MEIRLLNPNEIQWAVNTANEVFETCDRFFFQTPEEISRYYAYVNPQFLWKEMSEYRLFLWGVFEEGQMCAVSAMQNTGLITMLYVKQEFHLRRMGAQLLNAMYMHAANVLRLDRVTVHVLPVQKAPYFYKMGFFIVSGQIPQGAGVLLEHRLYQNISPGQYGMPYPGQLSYSNVNMFYDNNMSSEKKDRVSYPTRKVSSGLILAITAATLVLSAAIIIVITIMHIITNV